jgi:hypothetical protein
MKYSEEITQVHTDFEQAGEILLKEAKEYLSKVIIPKEGKVNKLKSLGFVKSREFVETDEMIRVRNEKNKLSKLIEYYNRKYPFNKFITEDMVKIICGKYGLIMGSINDYTGFVPEKCVDKIFDFKINKYDAEFITCSIL